MIILIYGGKGWIGTQFIAFINAHHTSIKIIFGESRVDDIIDVKREIDNINPTHVLSFIGRTYGNYKGSQINSIDFLEQPGNLGINIRDNLFGPLVLALLCKDRGIHFTYLGTGCIFDYNQIHCIGGEGFKEDDTPNFTGSSYSTVKGYTDQLMHLLPVLNLRIRMPIGSNDHPRNFISKIIRYSKICSISNSMTVLDTFFPIFIDLMERKIIGTFNCTNPGVISHNEILEMYKRFVDTQFTWENFSIEEQNKVLYSQRSNNYLDTSKITTICNNITIPNIKDAIEAILRSWKKSK